MPQIKQGQVQPGQSGAPDLYGVNKVENTLPFHQRLLDRFKPHEFVTIKNIAEEPIYWQYLPSTSEEITMTQDGMQKTVQRGMPEMWVINPGETEVLVGASAYMALDVMYKNVMANKTLKRHGITASFDKENNHVPKNFNFSDAGAQEDFIKQAYIGKAELAFAPVDAPKPEVDPENPPQIKSMAEVAQPKETANAGKK